jgi:hypothetical protein
MATNYSGFAEGFQGGFGLMSDAFDKRRLRDIQEQEREDMAKYRLDQTGLERDRLAEQKRSNEASETAASLAADRANEADIRADELRKKELGVLDTNAATAGVKANTASVSAQAAADAAAAERAEAAREQKIQEDALLTNELIGLAEMAPEERALPQNAARVDEIIEALSGSQFYDPSKALRPDMSQYNQEIAGVMTKIASGEEIAPGDITPGVRAAITEGLSVNNAKFVGSKITADAFPQAPASAAGGTILDVHVHDVTVASGTPAQQGGQATPGQLKAKVAVKYRTANGTIGYYYPDLTNNRTGSGGTPFSVSLDEAGQAYAGRSTNPRFKELVEERLITRDHGGSTEFNDQVEKMTETIIEELKSLETVGAGMDDLLTSQYGPKFGGIVQVGEDAQDLANNVLSVRERVRERLLYGRSVRSEIERSDAFVSKVKEGLRSQIQPIGTGQQTARTVRGGRKVASGEVTQNIEQFLGVSLDDLSSQQLVMLNEFFEPDGSITDENKAKLIEFKAKQIVI